MDKIFKLRGTVVSSSGAPIPNLRFAIVDKDPFIDDLLGIGFTNRGGDFNLSFTESEFNQESFERETVPDIYIVFSVYRNGEYVAIDRQNFYGLKFQRGSEDLGRIIIRNWGDKTFVLKNQNSTPGLDKKVSRLKIDNDLVSHCLTEIAPMIEYCTGWKLMLDKLNVLVINEKSFRKHMREVMENIGIKSSGFIQVFSQWPPKAYATYEPFQKRIYINEKMVKRCNLDGLKVILGHELVHFGQYSKEPFLIDIKKNIILEISKKFDQFTEETMHDLLGRSGKSFKEVLGSYYTNIFDIGSNSKLSLHDKYIEGYAYFIQQDFLQKYYNCALLISHVSLLYRVLLKLIKKAKIKQEEFESFQRELYRDEINKHRLLSRRQTLSII